MATTKWILDPMHSELGFKIKHLMITNISGSFKSFQVVVKTEDEDFRTAEINVTIDPASISTNNEQRDAHLLAPEFFDTGNHPDLTFRSTGMEKDEAGTFALYGELTVKGVTKPTKLDVEFGGVTKDPWGGERAGFTVTGKIKRSDWGISFNSVLETGGLALGEEVKINAEIQMVKQPVAVPA